MEWKTERRRVLDLVPLEINPRKISEEKKMKLIQSLERFNLVDIPVVNLDNKLISGHQRIKALIILGRGEELIDVRIPDHLLSEKEVKEYNIISNTHSGEFDLEMLLEHFQDIDFGNLGVDIDLSTIEVAGHAEKIDCDEDRDIEDVQSHYDTLQTDIQTGDIINIGPHRLMCGDSTVWENWKLLLLGERISLMVTDPPYNIDYTGRTKDALKIKNDKMKAGDFYNFLLNFYASAASHCVDGCVWYIWHADTEGHNFRQAFLDAGMKLSQTLIWVKNSLIMGRNDYHWQHEPCLYGWKPGAPHYWYNDRKQTTLMHFDRPVRNADHPTMKPIKLFQYLIENSSKYNDVVADGFLGSGTTMIACHGYRRRCFGVELDPKYCQVIIDRMKRFFPDIQINIEKHEDYRRTDEEGNGHGNAQVSSEQDGQCSGPLA